MNEKLEMGENTNLLPITSPIGLRVFHWSRNWNDDGFPRLGMAAMPLYSSSQ